MNPTVQTQISAAVPVGPEAAGVERVVIINDFSRFRAGATGIALASMRLLRARGVPVTFIAGEEFDPGGGPEEQVERISIGGRPILALPARIAVVQGLFNRTAEKVLSDWISNHDTPGTIYHLHEWSKILSPSVFHALKPVASRLVISAHDFFLSCPNGGYVNFRRHQRCELEPMGLRCLLSACDRRSHAHKLWRSARQWVRTTLFDLRAAGAILAVHEAMIPHLAKGGVPTARLRALRNPVVPWRTKRVSAERNSAFMFVGRLDEDKGVDLIVRAARRAGVQLVLIGDGPLQPPSAGHPGVEYLGWRCRAEISDVIANARALVVPSRVRESFGVAAVEALMSGVPVVISKNAMIAEEVASAGFGVSFDPYDEEEFASTLSGLAGDDGAVERMSRRSYAQARRLAPTPEQWGERLIAIYRELLSPFAGERPVAAMTSLPSGRSQLRRDTSR